MTVEQRRDYDYIEDYASLVNFCDELGTAGYCAIDTEFIRESTYYPELALVQIASEDRLACIDPLAIDDLGPLAGLLARDDLVKVFHSPSQDLEILYQKFGTVPTPVFDTQLAAAVLGYNHQISYADLVRQVTGVYRVKAPGLKPLASRTVRLLREFDEVEVVHVRRELNTHADALANRALDELDEEVGL